MSDITSSYDYQKLTILGSGYLCGTMEAGSSLVVNLNPDGNFPIGIPAVSSFGNAGGLVGTMGSGAQLSLNLNGVTTLSTSGVTAQGDGNAGGLVGELTSGAVITLPSVNALSIGAVTSESGNAGGLVGTMDSGAQVPVTNAISLSIGNVTAGNSAGGLVGEATDPGIASLPSIVNSANATISGKKAGGLIGRLGNTKNASFTLNANVQNLTISGSESSGGLFGELHNDKPADAAISYTLSAPAIEVTDDEGTTTTSPRISNISLEGGSAGGLIGKYFANDLANTLKIDNASATSSSSATNYGGVIGYVDGSKGTAYIELNNITSKSSDKPTNLGGLIGGLSDHGHFVNIGGNISISHNNGNKNMLDGTEAVGGLIGYMNSGVLYLTAAPSFGEMTHDGDKADKCGWILGARGNTLVYTTAANWTPRTDDAANNTNDTGVWGQVLRADQLTGLITVNSDHTVTVKAPASVYSTNGETTTVAVTNDVTISDNVDFAAVALRLQLNEVTNGALRLAGGDFIKGETVTITLADTITNAIDLNNTGLTGLTRDVNSTDVFNLTINGNGKTITLPDLKVYASGNGHDRQGLIGKAGELSVGNLTVGGVVKSHSLAKFYAGGVLAEATGSFSLTGVISRIDMTIDGGGNDDCAFSGFVGSTTKDCKQMTFSSCTYGGSITDNTGKNPYIGGMLAYANNNQANDSSFTVFANNCSISDAAITVANAPSNYARVGGLFASLYYGNYTLTISDLSVSGLRISVEKIASGNISNDPINPKFCGGLLGCEWMKVKATIQNVTIQNSSLNAGAVPFGGLVYKSSGHWNVQSTTVTENEKEVVKPGIHFKGDSSTPNKFQGGSPIDFPSGLLVSRGDNILNGNGTMRSDNQKSSEQYALTNESNTFL